MKNRNSIVLDKLRNGETVFSFKSNFSCPRPVEMAAIAGFDCVWLCQEHCANDYGVIEKQILAAKANGCDSMVRVPRGSYSDLIQPLELDASGILVPHVMSEQDARNIVWQTRFHPQGRRPVDGGNRDGRYCFTPFKEYTQFVNRNRFVFLQIEDIEAMEELDGICSVEGFDAVFFGPGDYSQSIGYPGEINHPLVQEARKKVAECALKHGKFAATVGSIANFRELQELGYRFINLGSDVGALGAWCRDTIQKAKG